MAAHDACPRRLRHAMHVAVHDYAAEEVLAAFAGQILQSQIIETLRKHDRKITIKTYGPTHPEAI